LRCNQTVSPIYSFTLEDEANDYSFNVWADSQSGWEAFASQVHLLKKHDDAFGVGAGDLVGNGSDQEEWETFFSILSESASERPYYLVPGNHDYDGYYDDLKPVFYNEYTGYDPSNYFSWSYGNAAFIALDPNENFPIGIPENSEQYLWLQDQLKTESWKHAQWRFVFLHQTLYSQGWQGYHGDSVLRDVLEPLIESGKIDFIISGHTHDYERLSKQYGEQEVTFLVVGGAGGSLEAKGSSTSPVMDVLIKQHHMGRFYLYDDSLRFEAIGMDGQLLDSFKRFKKL
jgi:predicted phosphodiesterase